MYQKIYKNFVGFVLGLNGVLLLLIGARMIRTAASRVGQFSLDNSGIAEVLPIFQILGVSDAALSLFSFVAMVMVFRLQESARIFGYVVGAHLIVSGTAIYMVTDQLFGLTFILPRGLIICGLIWGLARVASPAEPGRQ